MSDLPQNPKADEPTEPIAASEPTQPPEPSQPPTPNQPPTPPQPQMQEAQPSAQPSAYAPPQPQAPMYESEARNISMWLHYAAAIAAIVSGGLLGFVVPLVMWLIYKDRSALVDFHGKQNLNLQLTGLVVGVGAVIIGVITLFIGFFLTIPLWIAYWIYSLVICFVAGTAAQRGEYYRIKLTIPFLK